MHETVYHSPNETLQKLFWHFISIFVKFWWSSQFKFSLRWAARKLLRLQMRWRTLFSARWMPYRLRFLLIALVRALNQSYFKIIWDSESEDGKSKSVVSGPAARLANLRTNPATYCNEAEDMVHFLQWTESFNVEGQEIKAEISDIMVECPEVRALYSKLVPSAVAHNDFWVRYFYK